MSRPPTASSVGRGRDADFSPHVRLTGPEPTLKPIACNLFARNASDFNAAPAVSEGRLFLLSNNNGLHFLTSDHFPTTAALR